MIDLALIQPMEQLPAALKTFASQGPNEQLLTTFGGWKRPRVR
jgi:hypothetical protein